MLLPNVDAGAKPCEVGDELAPPPKGDDERPRRADAAPKPDGDDAAPNPPEAGAGAEPKGVEVPKAGCGLAERGSAADYFGRTATGVGSPPPANIVAAASSKHCSGAVIQAVARPDFVGVAYSNNL